MTGEQHIHDGYFVAPGTKIPISQIQSTRVQINPLAWILVIVELFLVINVIVNLVAMTGEGVTEDITSMLWGRIIGLFLVMAVIDFVRTAPFLNKLIVQTAQQTYTLPFRKKRAQEMTNQIRQAMAETPEG